MRLVDLDPVWIMRDGERIGFTFLCPTGAAKGRQSCFRESPARSEQWKLFAVTHGPDGDDHEFPRDMIQGCTPGTRWAISGEFENLTVTPSIDGSAGGNWHGFITNGQIVGGL